MTNQEIYDSYKKRSTTGASSRRNGNKKIRMNLKDYRKSLCSMSLATAIAVSGLIAGGSHLVDSMQKSMIINNLHRDFRMEYIVPETHRTEDHQNYYYDYDHIAQHLEDYEEFDVGLYLLETDIGEYQTNKVMNYTKYGTIDDYLEQKGYKDNNEFKKTMEKKIVLLNELEENKNELQEMMQPHQTIEDVMDNTYSGGSK